MNCLNLLIALILVQSGIILYLLNKVYEKNSNILNLTRDTSTVAKKDDVPKLNCSTEDEPAKKPPGGVAVTLMLHAPLWYQRRYTMMIQNIAENIPDDWLIQIFYTATGGSLKGIEANPGIKPFLEKGKAILTTIPDFVLKKKKKRFELMAELWLWENVLAEKVLIFGGGSVICSNSPNKLESFLHFDYIGPPWNAFKGLGGDGSISLRSRSLMTATIQYEYSKYGTDKQKIEDGYKRWGQEDHFFVSRLQEMSKKGFLININDQTQNQNRNNKKKDNEVVRRVFIANKNDSMKFAAIDGFYNYEVFAVSGILAAVPFKDRDKFIQHCPEIKMFYPSLHDPNCFGASPDSEKCAASICALKPKTERRGGC